ncbi:MAG TPA: MFS transporter [Acidimicrobiales bacterium]|nr:MFS transporter [Acidimicrobiales bacterium]
MSDTGALRRQRVAVTALFFVNGATFSSWLPRIPEVRDRLDVTLGELGAVLLGTGLGGLLASVAGGALVDRLGSRRSCVIAAVVLSAGLPLIAVAVTPFALGFVLAGLGAVDVLADIGMNVQGAQVQRRTARSVMQRFHGAWSVGALAGGGVASLAAGLHVSLGTQLSVTGVLLVGAVLAVARHLSPADDPPLPQAEGARRLPVLALLAAVALTIAVVEGAPGEWAAVFGADVHDASPGVAGLGYLAVTAGMVLGRFLGDAATDRFGSRPVFRGALLLSAAGLAVVTTSPAVVVAVAGFAVIGLGVSVLFPALYLEAAEREGIPAGLGLGVMSTGARLGFLLSPPLVGAVAGASSLRASLGVVVGTAIVAALAFEAGLMRHSGGGGQAAA